MTNEDAAKNEPPADVNLEIEWWPMGHATNHEVASWIAEYDGITQVDYLETHATTDWQNDFEAALEEADREVVENGNRDSITDAEILEWASQWEEAGPDGVDEELRRVPFLETRAAAKEIGASIEFNKAEGVDSVDGGVVYRAELDADYDVSTLEPVVVGPDGSDPAPIANDALINVDNVHVMDDGRVLCCEDADQFGRSYSNDCLYVFRPSLTADRAA